MGGAVHLSHASRTDKYKNFIRTKPRATVKLHRRERVPKKAIRRGDLRETGIKMKAMGDPGRDSFRRLEEEGWERAAPLFARTWGSLTSLFVGPLLDALDLRHGASLLDVGCGPGYL